MIARKLVEHQVQRVRRRLLAGHELMQPAKSESDAAPRAADPLAALRGADRLTERIIHGHEAPVHEPAPVRWTVAPPIVHCPPAVNETARLEVAVALTVKPLVNLLIFSFTH